MYAVVELQVVVLNIIFFGMPSLYQPKKQPYALLTYTAAY